MLSYQCTEIMDKLDLETFTIGDSIHLRVKSSKEVYKLHEEKLLFMELYEKNGIAMRAQFQNDGFWGTAMRNDFPGQNDMNLPQGVGLYEWNSRNSKEPSEDIWPRMYTKAWLNGH